MFKRENYPEDPFVSINDHSSGEVVYGGNSFSGNQKILETEGGMDVFVRNTK